MVGEVIVPGKASTRQMQVGRLREPPEVSPQDLLAINQSITQVGMISNAGGSPYTVQLIY